MRRAFVMAALVGLGLVLILLNSEIRDFLWTHPWWHSFLVGVPTIALPILAYFEWRHSGEANALRNEANSLRAQSVVLQGQILDLNAKLDAERNQHLQQIAKNTEKPVTHAEKNARTLRKYSRAKVVVSEGQGSWPNTPEIVEVSDENIVTLFTPYSYSSGRAWCVSARCDELEISEIPQGSCPLRLKILKRYGPDVQLGEITKWEERLQSAASPIFGKGDVVYSSTYKKPGSAETRTILVFASRDGSNSFLLEASTGEKATGDNVEISKRFMLLQVEYEAAGFTRNSSGTGGSPHRIFVH